MPIDNSKLEGILGKVGNISSDSVWSTVARRAGYSSVEALQQDLTGAQYAWVNNVVRAAESREKNK